MKTMNCKVEEAYQNYEEAKNIWYPIKEASDEALKAFNILNELRIKLADKVAKTHFIYLDEKSREK